MGNSQQGEPTRCPHCCSQNIVKVVYGLPTKESAELLDQDKAIMMGCFYIGEYYCRECHQGIKFNRR